MPDSKRFESFSSRLRGGFFPAVPVPFDAGSHFVPAAQNSYTSYMVRQPITGVATWAHTGRGLHLEEALAREVLGSWRKALGDLLLIAGAGAEAELARRLEPGDAGDEGYIGLALRMAERAAEGGADGLLAYAPARFRQHPGRRDLIRRYHAALASVGLPVIAFYLYEAAGGINYTLDELRVIFEIDGVVALKMATLDSVCTFQHIAELARREFPEKVLISGEDRFLGYSILRGAAGALVGMGSACPAFQKNLLDTWHAGDHERFVELLQHVDRFAECTFIAPMEGYIERMLHALSVLEVIPQSATHDPWGPGISPEERQRIARVIDELRELGEV